MSLDDDEGEELSLDDEEDELSWMMMKVNLSIEDDGADSDLELMKMMISSMMTTILVLNYLLKAMATTNFLSDDDEGEELSLDDRRSKLMTLNWN